MAPTSTDRACDRCRERRVKCDKRHPTCQRCEKFGQPCPGYDKKRKFVDEGATLRKKFQNLPGWTTTKLTSTKVENGNAAVIATPNPILGVSPTSSGTDRRVSGGFVGQLGSTPLIVDGFGESNGLSTAVHVEDLRKDVTQTVTESLPGPATDLLLWSQSPNHDDVDQILDEILNDPSYDPEWFNLQPEEYYGQGNNSCGFIPNLPNIIDEVDRNDFMQTTEPSATPFSDMCSHPESVWAPESQQNTSAIITDEREHEMAFLVRHFTESIGPWMDLFDKDEHFSHLVPLKALRDALLRNAIAAVAAKQLGRVKGQKPSLRTQHQMPSTMETIDNIVEVDWFYKAASYYDKAITFSRVYLQALSGNFSDPPTPNALAAVSVANSDDLLVAVSIFSLYESLDNLELGWLQHLTGLKSLLSAVRSKQPMQSQLGPTVTTGRQASFWNFARADYQAAYINHQQTLLDTEDLELWQSCGLQIQSDNSLYINLTRIKHDQPGCREIAQLVSRTLIWLVLCITNYVASDHERLMPGRRAIWERLSHQLDLWHSNLPETFQPCAQIRHPLQKQSHGGTASRLHEVFFSINQCAAAMQLYHFARILLLLNKPNPGAGLSRLEAYREVSSEAIDHAREICSIALGRPHPAVRVEMLLSLYIAGTCLETDDERRVVLDLLKAIEQDTGCSTEAKVRSLVDEWGWTQGPAAVV